MTGATKAGWRALPRGGLVLLGVLLVVTVASRLVGLDHRMPHHDEMVHQWFSEMLAFEGDYRASPAYHGPLLYHLQAGVMQVLGSGLWQGRLVPALAGLGAALALIGLAMRETGPRAGFMVAILIGLSPIWTYYARFNSHDSLILLCTASVAWGRWHWSQGRTRLATWLIVLALGLAWSTKLNALFIAGAIVLWPAVRWGVSYGTGRRWTTLRPPVTTVVAAVAVTLVMIGALFTSTFRSELASAGVVESLAATVRAATVDPVAHWASMHQEQRLPGPFHYYVALVALYEPLLVLAAGFALGDAWRRTRRPWRLLALALAAGVLLAVALWPMHAWVETRLHLHPVHVTVLPAAAIACWLLARQRAAAGDEAGVWWVWLAVSQTLLYGYAGEKVPWLAVHVTLPWIMVAGAAMARAWTAWPAGAASAAVHSFMRRVAVAACGIVAVGALLVTAWGQYAVVAWTGSDPAEPLVQLEYAPETHRMLQQLATTCASLPAHDGPCIETTREAGWPAQWYLRVVDGDDAVGLDGLDAALSTPYVFVPARRTSALSQERAGRFDATHVPQPVRFTMWGVWVEWLQRPRLDDIVQFWARRRSLGPRRGLAYELWVRRDVPAPDTSASEDVNDMTKGPTTR